MKPAQAKHGPFTERPTLMDGAFSISLKMI
jgi:hypothetical protein